jgi:hypothetical protein
MAWGSLGLEWKNVSGKSPDYTVLVGQSEEAGRVVLTTWKTPSGASAQIRLADRGVAVTISGLGSETDARLAVELAVGPEGLGWVR